ncbi:MAG: M1 family metallopeptidase [Gemmatimonadota bacterium]
MRMLTALTLICLVEAAPLTAQSVDDASPFRPLDLPAPNAMRTGAGRPGPLYWQQRADYRIQATLDPGANALNGTEIIHYTNNSPSSLGYLWLQVEQNMCDPSSVTNQLDQPPLVFLGSSFDFSCKGFAGGLVLSRLRSGGQDLAHTIYGTMMRVDLPSPLPAGGSLDLDLAWSFAVPAFGGGRMGHDGTLYEFGQWYPRMAVYDDVRGWNHEPYIGAGEFYLEYGAFDVSITVPSSYIVSATGVLKNPEQVLTATQRSRLEQAARSDTAIAIITASEAGDMARTRPNGPSATTWHFTADSVRDFAFAAAPNFRWDASAYHTTLIHTYYRPGATLWTEANQIVREGLKYYSEQWYPYPYPHMSSIEGPVEGMEYPMMTFDPTGPARIDLQWVLAHELGHQWTPMIVGSNERLYPWMDEGFNTFIDLANAANYFRGTAYGDSIEVHPLHLYADHAIAGQEQPLITKPVEVNDLFWVGYQKPALMMQQLRYEVLGKERFDQAYREYLKTWAFKHPTPADFFRIMRDQSGMELDWFWRGWVMTTARLDQSVDSVTSRGGKTGIHLSNRGTMVMPAELRITWQGGKMETVKLPVEMWNQGQHFTYRVNGRVTRVELDPRKAMPDTRRVNNIWPRSAARTSGTVQLER